MKIARLVWGLAVSALLAATACSHLTLEGEPGQETGAVSGGLTLTVSVPPGRTADQVGIAATRNLTLGDRAVTRRAAPDESKTFVPLITNVGTGVTRLGNDVHVGDVFSRAKVVVGDRSVVEGFARSGGSITLGNDSFVTGDRVANMSFGAPVTHTWTAALPAQIKPDIALEPDRQGTAAPGRYRKLIVKSRSTLMLSAGAYFVEDLQLEPQATLLLDQTAGPVRMYVTSSVIYRGSIATTDARLPRFFLGYTGTKALALEGPFTGSLVAPNADIRLASLPVPHAGRFIGRDVAIDPGTLLELLPPSDCGDPLIPNGAKCSDGNACTTDDRCQNGVCTGQAVEATCPGDACHEPGVCDPVTATCKRNPLPDGLVCLDGQGTEGICLAERCLTPNTGCTVPSLRQRWQTRQGGWRGGQDWLSGDFNGDGFTDTAMMFSEGGDISIDVHQNRFLEGLSEFGQQRWATRQGGWQTQRGWAAEDFDGDGRTDIALAFQDNGSISIDVHRSTVIGGVDAFENARWQTRTGGWPGRRAWLAGDFTGDGLPDMAMAFDNGGVIATDIHPNAGGRFEGLARWPTNGPVGWPSSNRWVTGDFDGDAALDLAMAFDDDGSISIDVHLNRNGSFQVERWQDRNGGWNNGAGFFQSGDFDGDGDVDITFAFFDKGEISMDLHENVGGGFERRRFASFVGGWPSDSAWLAGDFDGNGSTDLAKPFEDDGDISIDTYLSGEHLVPCVPSGIAFQGFVLENSHLGDLEANEAQGIANSSEDWYWTSILETAKVPVGGSIIDPVDVTATLGDWFREIDGTCDDGDRGYDHFSDPDFHDGVLYVPVTGNCVPSAVLAFSPDLQLLGWGTLGRGGGAWVSLHPHDGWLYTSGTAPGAPVPPGPGRDITVIRAYDARLENMLPPPASAGEIENLLAGCNDAGVCPATDLGYIGHLQLVPLGTPPARTVLGIPHEPGSWDDYAIQGGDISPNGVLYYVFDHKSANSSHLTGAHVFNLTPFGSDAIPSSTGITGLDAPEVYVDGDEGRGYLNADYDAWVSGPFFSSRLNELEGVTVYRGSDGLIHVLMMLLTNQLFLDDVTLYHWTTNEP